MGTPPFPSVTSARHAPPSLCTYSTLPATVTRPHSSPGDAGARLGFTVGRAVGLELGVAVGVAVAVGLGVRVGVGFGVAVGLGVGVGGSATTITSERSRGQIRYKPSRSPTRPVAAIRWPVL